MKNPLVDVIRQSTGSDQTLSDSGSFDTRDAEFGPTANDAAIEAVLDDELELLESTGAIILDNGTISFQVHDPGEDVETALQRQDEQAKVAEFDPERAPLISRYAPAICLAAALAAALGWSAWTTVREYASESSMGMNQLPLAGVADGSVEGTVHIAGAERFPFIDPDARSDAGEGE